LILIYLDNNATTPVAPEVLAAMLPLFRDHYGNPASTQHAFGWSAEEYVKIAREQTAAQLDVEPGEIVFTSGATEGCNLGIKGVFDLYQRKGKHIVTVATEHKAVLDTCKYLETRGAEVTYLPVNSEGALNLDQLRDAIRANTILVAVMWANNETGLIHPMADVGEICADKETLLFSDATQAVGKIQVNPRSVGVHLLALSAHKIYGPKGVGALYVSRRSPRVKLTPLIHGGGHEGGMRSGTLNAPGIVGLGMAMELASGWISEYQMVVRAIRDQLETELLKMPSAFVNGSMENRLPHVSNLRFEGINASSLMTSLSRELAVASGSACTSADPEPSHVLQAMGFSTDQAKASLRFSLGRQNTIEEIAQTVEMVKKKLADVRSDSML
jgi:cysteine desulfurase